jgi:hypothetical protein
MAFFDCRIPRALPSDEHHLRAVKAFHCAALCIALLGCGLSAEARETGKLFLAAASSAVITPDVRNTTVYMAGIDNNRIARGVHDNLYVRCLALRAGDRTVELCSVDLIGLSYDDVRRVRRAVQRLAPQITHLIVGSTHNHEGPDTIGLWGPSPWRSGLDPKYMNCVDGQIAQTAVRAVCELQPARLVLGRSHCPALSLLQSDSRPPYVKDPYLFALEVQSGATGKVIATLVNWSDHPETLGSENTWITADYPHWVCRYLEHRLGGVAVFFSGSIGGLLSTTGVAIQDPETGDLASGWRKAELIGDMVGQLAERALRNGEAAQPSSWMIRQKTIFVPVENPRFRLAQALGIFQGRGVLYTAGRRDPSFVQKTIPGFGLVHYPTGGDARSEVDYLQLLSRGRPTMEIVTIPGEIYPELVNGGITRYFGADYPDAPFEPILRPHLKTPYQFIFGLGNDELGYLIPKAEWDNQPPWLQGRNKRWYGEINSAGPDAADAVMEGLIRLIEAGQSGRGRTAGQRCNAPLGGPSIASQPGKPGGQSQVLTSNLGCPNTEFSSLGGSPDPPITVR